MQMIQVLDAIGGVMYRAYTAADNHDRLKREMLSKASYFLSNGSASYEEKVLLS